jgi:hypothetical protein
MGITSSRLVSDPRQFATLVSDSEEKNEFKPEREYWKEYDYVICGGGMCTTMSFSTGTSSQPDIPEGTAACSPPE